MSRAKDPLHVPDRAAAYLKYIAASVVAFGGLGILLFGFLVTQDAAGKTVGLVVGLVVGLLFGWWAASRFHIERLDFPRIAPERFEDEFEAALAARGYELASRRDGLWVFRPTARAGGLARRTAVRIRDDKATLVGPSELVHALLPIEYQEDREYAVFD